MYKIMLGMSYYIHGRGLGALVDGARPDSKGIARSAGHALAGGEREKEGAEAEPEAKAEAEVEAERSGVEAE